MPLSLLALAAGAFGIGTTEFIVMGLLTQVGADVGISIPTAGTLISGYAVGVAVGAPLLTIAKRHWPRKQLLMALMLIFIAGNAAAALARGYGWLMGARVLTSLTHGTFFGVGAVVATGLVPAEKRASAIARMFSGLTLAALLGVPAGAWIGQLWGWRASFWVVALVGVAALAILAAFVPRDQGRPVVAPLSQELAVLRRPQVWLGLGITVFGFAGVFALYTYIEPLLRRVTHMSDGWVTATLLLFGAGLAAGNLLGGRLADKGVMQALAGSIGALMVTLALGRWAFGQPGVAMSDVVLLGTVAFATWRRCRCACCSRPAPGAPTSRRASTSRPSTSATPSAPGWAGWYCRRAWACWRWAGPPRASRPWGWRWRPGACACTGQAWPGRCRAAPRTGLRAASRVGGAHAWRGPRAGRGRCPRAPRTGRP